MSGRATKRRGMTSAVRWWLFIFEIAAITVIVRSVWANSPVTFDMAPAAVARPVTGGPWTVLPGYEAVEVRLQVSTLIDPGLREPVEQLLYRFASRERQAIVLDYSPRTEMLSAIDGAVEVVITDEATQHVGLNMTGVYPPVKTDACLDQNQKNLQSTKYRQQVKHESVVASGTIDQSRGAYFKLRSAYDRTLEGDKPFSLILQLPLGWQTSTLDVQLQAWGQHGQSRRPLAAYQTTVALWREGNETARNSALRMAHAVQALRVSAEQYDRAIRDRSRPTVFHKLGAALEVVSPKIPENWLELVLMTNVDAYHDDAIASLPVDVRVAILEYQDAREQLIKLNSVAQLVKRMD